MSRVACLLLALSALALPAPASAADYNGRRAHASVEVVETNCRDAVVETVRYQEQVCRKGVSGYAYCRWVDRQHDVRVPESCGPKVTTEGTEPAKRGAFPPYPHG